MAEGLRHSHYEQGTLAGCSEDWPSPASSRRGWYQTDESHLHLANSEYTCSVQVHACVCISESSTRSTSHKETVSSVQ